MKKNIVLIGFMGVGKTTIGRKLSMLTDRYFYDTDSYIAKCENMSVHEVMKKKGAAYFKGAESFAVMNLSDKENAVIATGGSTVLNEENRNQLRKSGILVWIRGSAQTIYDNTSHSHNKRPEIQGKSVEEIDGMLSERAAVYGDCDLIVDVDGRDLDAITRELTEKLQPFGG